MWFEKDIIVTSAIVTVVRHSDHYTPFSHGRPVLLYSSIQYKSHDSDGSLRNAK